MGKLRDLSGQKFGRLTAVRRSTNKPGYGQAVWFCQCDCGNTCELFGYLLCHNKQQSCGCLLIEARGKAQFKHGESIDGGTSEFHSWCSMRGRCMNEKNEAYPLYGGRGITVCEQWNDFRNFKKDMGDKPSARHSLDRINNDGNYEPRNCRWAIPKQQVRNRRTTCMIECDGEKISLQELGEKHNIPYRTIWIRYKKGWRGKHLVSLMRADRRRN